MQDKRIDLFGLLKQEGKLTKILVIPGIAKEIDPISHEKGEELLNPLAIDAFVRQITPEAIVWKYWGQIEKDSLEIICETRWYETLKSAKKIIVNDQEYKTLFSDKSGFNVLKRENYLIVVIVRADK